MIEPTVQTVYKIRRSDGLFSMGGSSPSFNKKGKIWKERGHLTSHLNIVSNNRCDKYQDCQIVVYQMIETPTEVISISGYMAERQQAKLKQEEQRKIAQTQADIKRAQDTIASAQQELDRLLNK